MQQQQQQQIKLTRRCNASNTTTAGQHIQTASGQNERASSVQEQTVSGAAADENDDAVTDTGGPEFCLRVPLHTAWMAILGLWWWDVFLIFLHILRTNSIVFTVTRTCCIVLSRWVNVTLSFWGHVTSSVTWPIYAQYMISYRWSFETITLSCMIAQILCVKHFAEHVPVENALIPFLF